ncbi:MAG: pilus assembly PilX N-terminal domain-containing protein [candidate division NC10 bacterium]
MKPLTIDQTAGRKNPWLTYGEEVPLSMKGRGEEGIALVITLMVMTILLLMGTAFLSISSTETLIAINERNRIQAFHLAEAGAERAIAELGANDTYLGTVDTALGPGTYGIAVSTPPPPANPDQRLVTGTGCVRDCVSLVRAMAQVEVLVQKTSPFQRALAGLQLVELEDRVVVDSYDSAQGPYNPATAGAEGHIASNGDITLQTNNTVKGDVQAGGSITLGAGSTITGSVIQGFPTVNAGATIPYPPCSPIVPGINPPGAYNGVTCDLVVDGGDTVTLDEGTYAFNKVALGPGAKLALSGGPVTIYMTDQFTAGNGAVINTSKEPTKLLIFSSYDGTDGNGTDAIMMAAGSGEFYGGIYALNGEVEFNEGGWQIYGAIVGKRIDIEDDARFHYDLALSRQATPADRFRPLASTWREVFAP